MHIVPVFAKQVSIPEDSIAVFARKDLPFAVLSHLVPAARCGMVEDCVTLVARKAAFHMKPALSLLIRRFYRFNCIVALGFMLCATFFLQPFKLMHPLMLCQHEGGLETLLTRVTGKVCFSLCVNLTVLEKVEACSVRLATNTTRVRLVLFVQLKMLSQGPAIGKGLSADMAGQASGACVCLLVSVETVCVCEAEAAEITRVNLVVVSPHVSDQVL